MNSSERVERGCQFLVGVPVVVVGFFVWMTHHPDAAWIEKAETLPVVGPLAEVFRGRWLPPALGPETPDEPLEVEVQAPPAEAPPVPVEVVGARPYVWLTPGQILRTEPRADSETLATVDAITNVRMLSRHDRWARVSYRRRAGWVELKETKKADTGNPPLGEAPAPNLPVPALEPSADRLAHARRLLGTQEASRSVGPYPLYTDFDDDALLEFLDRAASGVETSYSQRYGLTPIGEPREAVVLFAREEDYRAFSAREERIVGITATGHATAGLVALYAEGRPWWEVASTLVHEITHLVNRRALGPALPPWLDEGIAGDLGSSRFADDGSLVLGSLGGNLTRSGRTLQFHGARASLVLLQGALEEGRLSSLNLLLHRPWEEFVAPGRSQESYAQSAFLLRYLLDGERGELATGLRGFLISVARGEPASRATLTQHLEPSWHELEAGFRVWLALEDQQLGVPVAVTSRRR